MSKAVETKMVSFDGENLTLDDVVVAARQGAKVKISEEAKAKVSKSRELFENIANSNIPIYGVTTGYGEMVYMQVDTEKETELQTNLVKSHCAGVGPSFSEEESRAILAARINALSRGNSAVRQELIDRMILYLNEGIIPVIPQIGSLGASGDLAPLSHIAVTLLGEGYVYYKGEKQETESVLKEKNIEALKLKFKEGLALINGTSAMTGLGSLVVKDALTQVKQAEIVSALVLEILRSSTSPFLPEGHDIARPHKGQIESAYNIRELTAGSNLMVEHEKLRNEASAQKNVDDNVNETHIYLQKAYTLRCIPQMLGGVRDSLYHASKKIQIELNSSNDNPLFFEGEEIFHGGNFHGQPIAIVLDLTAIALTQVGVISERRTNRLLNRYLSQGLPEFLVKNDPGLNSGFAGAQYPATALVAENRTICSPASIQSIPSNGDNQDVVSMGLIAGRNAKRILNNNNYILAVEYLAAAQAVDIHDCFEKLSPVGKAVYNKIRENVTTLDEDRYMSNDIEKIAEMLSLGVFNDVVKNLGIKLY